MPAESTWNGSDEVLITATFSGRSDDTGAAPVGASAALPLGWCRDVGLLQLVDAHHVPLVAQFRPLERWPDGSLRWIRVDFVTTVGAGGTWKIQRDNRVRAVSSIGPVVPDAGAVTVDTGNTVYTVSAGRPFPVVSAVGFGRELVNPRRSWARLVGCGPEEWHWVPGETDVESAGATRTVVVCRGHWQSARGRLDVRWRLGFFNGVHAVRLEARIHNPAAAAHPNGHWDLGDSGSIQIDSLAFHVAGVATSKATQVSLEPGQPFRHVEDGCDVVQHSSGGEAWNSATHVDRHGRVPMTRRGYSARVGDLHLPGHRAAPAVVVGGDLGSVGLTAPTFWQTFPKRLAADSDGITYEILPAGEGPHELQGGERMTHAVYLHVSPDRLKGEELQWCRSPLRIRSSAGMQAVADVISPGSVPNRSPEAVRFATFVSQALEGDAAFSRKNERIDEYGWRHFGDLFADHESVRQPPASPLVSHYNNQYDAILGFAHQFLATGDWRWWDLMDDLARHVADIDIYHTVEDKAAYSGGMFWHTNHYVSAGTATHRAYSRQAGLPGGGPSCEQNYTSGLLHHYLLTGSPDSRDAVLELARWVLAMDDGRRSVLRWLDRGPTGLATATYTLDFQGPGRGAGNSINALLDAHRLTGEAVFLQKAEEFIRRCIHPDDDPGDHDLLDAERRWSYLVFLQVVGKYVAHKRERGDLDGMFSFARAALLKYADWMATHETPFLDRADRLEFPTETWVAQDIRKADVFWLAARETRGEPRRRFLERRDWFVRYVLDTLPAMPTATCTRPMVLMLTNGFRPATLDPPELDDREAHLDEQAWRRLGPPIRFVPQRRRVERKLMRLAAIAAAALLAGAAWALFG